MAGAEFKYAKNGATALLLLWSGQHKTDTKMVLPLTGLTTT
ncbi:MAG TPA: hypothetical protein PLT28_00150 [Saprospiraceae bacterium]|nr:hypothetical protein [Saprospiraceae bacterium]